MKCLAIQLLVLLLAPVVSAQKPPAADKKQAQDNVAAPKKSARQAAKLIPGARLIEFPGMGHAPQMEDPAAFNKVLVEQLNLQG